MVNLSLYSTYLKAVLLVFARREEGPEPFKTGIRSGQWRNKSGQGNWVIVQRGIYTSDLRSIILILVMVADFGICFFFYHTLTFLLCFRDVSSSHFVSFIIIIVFSF